MSTPLTDEIDELCRQLAEERAAREAAERKLGSALDTAKSPPWRCFHCGEFFDDPKLAAIHFGPDREFDEPGCVARLTESEQELRQQVVDSYRECAKAQQDTAEAENDRRLYAGMKSELQRMFHGARSVWQAYCILDYTEGLVIVANQERDAALTAAVAVQEACAKVCVSRAEKVDDTTYEGRLYLAEAVNCEQAILVLNLDALRAGQALLDAKQAIIDRLMLEYCPDEMTPEQIAEWGRNQSNRRRPCGRKGQDMSIFGEAKYGECPRCGGSLTADHRCGTLASTPDAGTPTVHIEMVEVVENGERKMIRKDAGTPTLDRDWWRSRGIEECMDRMALLAFEVNRLSRELSALRQASAEPEPESLERRKAEWKTLQGSIDAYSEDYEYGEDGYTPNETELAMCNDFVQGLIGDDAFIAAIAHVYPVRSTILPAAQPAPAVPADTITSAVLAAGVREINGAEPGDTKADLVARVYRAMRAAAPVSTLPPTTAKAKSSRPS